MPLTRAATVLAAGLAAAAPHRVNLAISGAAITIVEKTAADVHLVIENNRDSPLVACGINSPWVYGGQDVRVLPHQRATVTMHVDEARPATRATTLDYAVFEDGYYEGNGRMFDQWLLARTAHIEDLRYWSGAFAEMPRVSIAEMRRFLYDRLAERESRPSQPLMMASAPVSGRVRSLLAQFPEGPSITRFMDPLRQDVEADLIAATRVPAGDARPGRVDAVHAATVVSAEPVPTKVYSPLIENLRDVGIEAFGFDEFEPTEKPRGGWGEDDYLSDPAIATPGRGRIQPHERRDLYQQWREPVPLVRLAYVMYDDHVFQGDAAQRQKLLRSREEEADEYPYALAAMAEAVTKPPAEIEAFLVEKLKARIKQAQPQGKYHPPMGPLDMMLRAVNRSPEQFLKDADAMRVKFEGQYQRITEDIAALR